MKKLKPEIFEKAAVFILTENFDFCCCALDWADVPDGPHEDFFASVFRPENVPLRGQYAWWTKTDDPESTYESRLEARILALLLCAEMCKTK